MYKHFEKNCNFGKFHQIFGQFFEKNDNFMEIF